VDASADVEYAVSRLERAIDVLVDSGWSEPLQNLAEALSEALVKTCRQAKARRAMRTAQALHALVSLDPAEHHLVAGSVREKLTELLALVRTFAART
jgi:hypothetical protein